jgi:hypothetical protein
MSETLPTETHDGFYLRQTKVELPLDNGHLDPKDQWDLLICHLFVNRKSPISAIARLGIDRPRIVQALLDHGAIRERRSRIPGRPEAGRQQLTLPSSPLGRRA